MREEEFRAIGEASAVWKGCPVASVTWQFSVGHLALCENTVLVLVTFNYLFHCQHKALVVFHFIDREM